jgi:hypothetical protein
LKYQLQFAKESKAIEETKFEVVTNLRQFEWMQVFKPWILKLQGEVA